MFSSSSLSRQNILGVGRYEGQSNDTQIDFMSTACLILIAVCVCDDPS